jgi:plasmid replication initiation protein
MAKMGGEVPKQAFPEVTVRDNDSIAIKHTGAVHVSNTLSLLQRKAANVLLKYAYKNLACQETHRVKLSEIAKDLGWSPTSHTNEKLKDAIRKLNMTQIEWNILGKDNKHEWGVATILAEATIRDGYCTYAYSPTMRKLQANPTLYARLDLLVQQSFDRSYTLALWEFLTEALCSGRSQQVCTSWIALEDFRRLMGVNTPYYHNFSKLNSKIIIPVLKEMNEKSDISVELRTDRNGRVVEAVSFLATRKPVHQLSLAIGEAAEVMEQSFEDELLATLEKEFRFSTKNAKKLLGELAGFAEGDISAALDHVRVRQKEGNIKNLQAYTATALKAGFTVPATEKPEEGSFPEEEEVAHPGWKEVRSRLRDKIGKAAYHSWIGSLQLGEIKDGSAALYAKNSFIQDWVKRNYIPQIQECWQEVDPAITAIKILVEKKATASELVMA